MYLITVYFSIVNRKNWDSELLCKLQHKYSSFIWYPFFFYLVYCILFDLLDYLPKLHFFKNSLKTTTSNDQSNPAFGLTIRESSAKSQKESEKK